MTENRSVDRSSRLSRLIVSLVYLVFFCTAAACWAAGPAEYVVVIVIDGCRPDYFNLAPLPNLEQLASEGTTYDSAWVGQLPTNTPPGHATLGTGVFPARHHVVDFRWKDPRTGKSYFPSRLNNLRSGALRDVIAETGVPSLLGLLKEAHPDSRALAISSVKPYAAICMGNTAADYILFTPSSKKQKSDAWGEEGIAKGQIRHFESLSGHDVGQEVLDLVNSRIAPYSNPGDFDTWVVDAFLVVFEKNRPRFAMLNLPETDEMGHKCGGINAPAIMKPVIVNVDTQIGRIVKAFKEAGIYERTLFVVTADHGMMPNAFNASIGSYVEAFLRPNDLPQLGLTSQAIWLRKSDRSQKVAEKLAAINPAGVGGIFYKAGEGGDVSYRAAGRNQTESSPAWDYLLDTIACTQSPDVILRIKENTVLGRKFPLNSRGKHYQGTWGVQHIPLIIAGPGVREYTRSEMPARLVDIPPTIIALMGIEAAGMDGIVLADAMASPSEAQIKTQVHTAQRLDPLCKALINQSTLDIEVLARSPRPGFWNVLWLCDLAGLGLLALGLWALRKAKLPRIVKYIGLSAGLFMLIAWQAIFVVILRKIMEI
jgi:hypothetical protein